jgi:hypothetical protein
MITGVRSSGSTCRHCLDVRRDHVKTLGSQIGRPVTHDDARAAALFDRFHILNMQRTHTFTWYVEAHMQYRYVTAARVTGAEFVALEPELGWQLLVSANLPCETQ